MNQRYFLLTSKLSLWHSHIFSVCHNFLVIFNSFPYYLFYSHNILKSKVSKVSNQMITQQIHNGVVNRSILVDIIRETFKYVWSYPIFNLFEGLHSPKDCEFSVRAISSTLLLKSLKKKNGGT